MKCGECGGYAEWKGPLSDLTHSECSQCGAVNSHLPDQPEEDEEDLCVNCEGPKERQDEDHCHCCANWLAGREP